MKYNTKVRNLSYVVFSPPCLATDCYVQLHDEKVKVFLKFIFEGIVAANVIPWEKA